MNKAYKNPIARRCDKTKNKQRKDQQKFDLADEISISPLNSIAVTRASAIFQRDSWIVHACIEKSRNKRERRMGRARKRAEFGTINKQRLAAGEFDSKIARLTTLSVPRTLDLCAKCHAAKRWLQDCQIIGPADRISSSAWKMLRGRSLVLYFLPPLFLF